MPLKVNEKWMILNKEKIREKYPELFWTPAAGELNGGAAGGFGQKEVVNVGHGYFTRCCGYYISIDNMKTHFDKCIKANWLFSTNEMGE